MRRGAIALAIRVVEEITKTVPEVVCGDSIRFVRSDDPRFLPGDFQRSPKEAAAQSLAQKTYEFSEFLVRPPRSD